MATSEPVRAGEEGSAVVEFLATALLLLIPTVYLILTFAAVQAATYAAESAARDVGRILSRSTDLTEAHDRAQITTHLAFADHGIDVDPTRALTVSCEASPCLTPGAGIHIAVNVEVPLPLLPDFLRSSLPAAVTVSADALATVDRFQEHQR